MRLPGWSLAVGLVACTPSEPVTAPTTPAVDASVPSVPASASGAAEAGAPASTLYVKESRAACEGGEGPRTCLQIRETESAEWTLFYGRIEGFEYEEGYRYELKVERLAKGPRPQDQSRVAYRLVEQVSKKKP